MPTNIKPEDVKTDATKLTSVWTDNTDFKLKDVTLTEFKAKQDRFEAVQDEITDKELEMTPLRNERDNLADSLNAICVRVRAGMKGYFGADSNEYEQAGGTRSSERKKPSRKSKITTPTT